VALPAPAEVPQDDEARVPTERETEPA
jgi:hypothetical protein